MLKEATSLFDYFNKCSKEKRYEKAAIAAYRYNYRTTVSFKKAKAWIEDWVKQTVVPDGDQNYGYRQKTCDSMVAFLNKFIKKMNQASATSKANWEARRGAGAVPPTPVAEAPPR
jgi:predicted ATP-binding protein involved in virulence